MNSNSNSNTSKNTINNTIKTENVIKAAIGSVLFPPKPTDGSEEIGHIPTTKVEEPQQLKTPEKSHSHKEEKSDGNGEASEKPVERTKRKYVRRNPRKNMKKKDDGSEVSDKTEKSLKDHLNHSKRSERKDKTSERNKTSDFYNPVEGNCGVNEMIEKTAGVNIHVENTPMGEYPYQHPQVCDPTQFYGINPYAQYQCYPQMMTSDQPQKPITLNLSESDVNVINQINQNTQFGQFQNIPENFRQMPILQPIIVQSQMQFQNYQNYPGCPIYTTFTQETGEKVQETSNDEGGKKKRTKKKKAEKDEKSGKKGGMLKPPMPTPLDTEKTKKSFQVLSKNLPSVLTEDAMIKTQKSISKDGAVEEDKCITERTETDDVENVQKTPQVALEGQQVQTQMQTVFTPVTLPPQFANLSLQTVNTFNQNISTNYSPNGCQLQGQVNSRQIVQNINNHTINTNTNRTVTPLNTTNQINRHTTPKSVATDKIKSLVKNGVAVMFGTLETIADDYKCQLYDIQTVQVKFAPLFPMNRNTPSDLEKNQFVTFLKTVEFANADLVVFCDEFGFQIENEQIVQAYPILGGIQVTRESRVSPILLGISRSGSVLREMCSCTQACAEQLNMIYRNVLYEVQFSFGLTKSGFSMWCQNVYYPYLNQQRQLIEKRVADKALDVFDETLMNKKKAILVLPECYIDFVNEDEMERNNVEVCYFSESVANFLFPTRKVFWEIQKKIYYSNNFRKESVCFMALQVIERLRNQIDERARQIALENAQTSPGKVIENYNEKSNEGVEHQDVLQGNVQSLEVKDCVENEKVGLCGTLEVQEKKINSEMEPFEIVCGDNLVTELTELSEKRVEHLKMTFGEPEETFEFDISSFPIGINLMCKDIVKTKGFKKLKSLVEVMAYFFENFQTIAPFINQVIAQYEQNKETPGFSA
ncbi:hypothetical protein EIN_412060 [Entamoeba invadens IP1]|uniref:Uncharacterized protein n=1 Tax=Entamoeba invadens IP1 TaxID=370355 RepID=A0A0A1UH02_ENTIV|nr:hypothetical protein EIN_412060 [Entamoeba invadens IP1]ELP95357.1 hypothetical protein EIN_412060 [Entamoeba invadens IP1]|eukprot:XP_004262128.1 hypothetical protein EIN_412060 [Entamoeba invadens IP1]